MTADERPACIGWAADPPCPEHGIMHGCRHAYGHNRHHECLCGHLAPHDAKTRSRSRADAAREAHRYVTRKALI